MATYRELTSELSHIEQDLNSFKERAVGTNKLDRDLLEYSMDHNKNVIRPDTSKDHLTFVVSGLDSETNTAVFTRKGHLETKKADSQTQQMVRTFVALDALSSKPFSSGSPFDVEAFLRREAKLKQTSVEQEVIRLEHEKAKAATELTSGVYYTPEGYAARIDQLKKAPKHTQSSTAVVFGDAITTSHASAGAIFAIILKKGDLQRPDEIHVKMLAGPSEKSFINPDITSHKLGLEEGDEAVILNASSAIRLLAGKNGDEKLDADQTCKELQRLAQGYTSPKTTQEFVTRLLHGIDTQIMQNHGKQDKGNNRKLLPGSDLVLSATITSKNQKTPVYNSIISDNRHPLAAQCITEHVTWNVQTALWKEDIRQKLQFDADALNETEIETDLRKAKNILEDGFDDKVATPLQELWDRAKKIEEQNKVLELELHVVTETEKPVDKLKTFRANLIKVAAAKHAVKGILDATKDLRIHLAGNSMKPQRTLSGEEREERSRAQLYTAADQQISRIQQTYVKQLKVPRTEGYNWFWKALDKIRDLFTSTKTLGHFKQVTSNFTKVTKEQVKKEASRPSTPRSDSPQVVNASSRSVSPTTASSQQGENGVSSRPGSPDHLPKQGGNVANLDEVSVDGVDGSMTKSNAFKVVPS